MAPKVQGFTLIELIIVVAIVGVLVGLGVSRINPNATATRQVAQAVAATVNKARFEAIRSNQTAGLNIVAGAGGQSGSLTICRNVDETVAFSCSTGEVAETLNFSDGDLGRAVISSPSALTVFFDRRGIVRNPSSSGHVITITDRSGANVRTVTILATGRAEVN